MSRHLEYKFFDRSDDGLLAGVEPSVSTGFLTLPMRPEKPRSAGLTLVIDGGLPTTLFRDYVDSHADLIDVVKLGWGTALATRDLETKLELLRGNSIGYFFGGTLFEKALQQNRVPEYFDFCANHGCEWIEISDGTLEIPAEDKTRYISEAVGRFKVLSEVGYKDPERSLKLNPARWVAQIRADLLAGAEMVVTEARESGTSGICRPDGELRYGLIGEILDAGIDPARLIFEAPNKALQSYFIRLVGSSVNLANIAFSDLVGLETLRLGLRSDTLDLT